ncbi:MAG TPA: glycosyltransferase, partial [Actinomycetota bacterium]|nr:glycosyltransferase [Actinomycetota bacterium]
ARADYLVFLNNDTEVITPGWIEAMLEYAQQPKIAAVGARLRHRDGTPQHEGVILGLAGTANNVDRREYFGQGSVVLNVSAVTAACMMTRADVYEELHGMEENLSVAFNDVDYCLRALAQGYRIVYTPYAELYHDESATRGTLHPPADEQFFRDRWGKPGEYVDPYYNPNLDPNRAYRVRTDR